MQPRAMPSGAVEGGIGQAHHPEGDQEAEESGEERNQQRDLERERSRVGVDADDLGLDVRGLADEQLLEGGVAHDLRVVLERVGDLLLLGRGEHGAVLGHVGERERQRRQHDRAGERQAEREPEEPAAEFTPAASLTRSSEIGASV